MAITESQLLDKLAATCRRARNTMKAQEERNGVTRPRVAVMDAVSWDWMIHGTEQERIAFDMWLVRVSDPLAFEAGTVEQRLNARVLRMVSQQADWTP